MYKVIINKSHIVERGNFTNPSNCPLSRAIREQLPEIDIDCVGGLGEIKLNNGDELTFYPNTYNISPSEVNMGEDYWGWGTYCKIKNGLLESFTVQIC